MVVRTESLIRAAKAVSSKNRHTSVNPDSILDHSLQINSSIETLIKMISDKSFGHK
jgi:hypothetical protein